jgi:hypothetical protein
MEQAETMSARTRALVIDQHFDNFGPHELINTCNGETVEFTGNITDDIHIVINGNTVNLSEHNQGQTIGIGSLGNTYISNVNDNVAFNGIPDNGGLFIIEDILIVNAISKNGAPNFSIRRNAHLTINANGVVTVDKIDFEILCHG